MAVQILEIECDDTGANPCDQRDWEKIPGHSAASRDNVPIEDATVSSTSERVENEMAFGDQLLLLASIFDALESEAELMVRLLK